MPRLKDEERKCWRRRFACSRCASRDPSIERSNRLALQIGNAISARCVTVGHCQTVFASLVHWRTLTPVPQPPWMSWASGHPKTQVG